MGLRVSDFNVDVLKGKKLVEAISSKGSEHILRLEDLRTGEESRVRIPAYFMQFLSNCTSYKSKFKTAHA